MDIQRFSKQFEKEYSFLYDHCDNVAGYREAVQSFDKFAPNNSKFVSEFCRYRNDIISSDREAAAFMFALETMI